MEKRHTPQDNSLRSAFFSMVNLTRFSFLFFLVIMIAGNHVQAQVANSYVFSETNGTYTAITGGTQLAVTTAGVTAFDTDGNNIALVATSQFVFNGTTITSVNMTADGSLWLNPTATTTGNGVTGPLASTAVASGVVSVMGMNLRSTTIATQVYERRWQDLGTELVFQWQNAARSGQEANERFSFQIRITKSTGVIRFVYGNVSLTNNNTTFQPVVGLRGSVNTDFNARLLTNTTPDNSPSWAGPNGTTVATANSNTVRFLGGANICVPASGLTYIWTPVFCYNTPTGLTFSGVTSSTATISWSAVTPTPTTGYQYYVSTVNTAPTGATAPTGSVANNVTSVQLTGLTQNQTYYVWVRAYCSATDFSAWSASTTFATPCGSFALPFLQGFNSFTFPACWSLQTVTGGSAITFVTSSTNPTTAPQEGTHFAYWNSFNITSGNQTRLVTPPLSTIGVPSVDVDFQWFHDNTAYTTSTYADEGVFVEYSLDGVNWVSAGPQITRLGGTNGWSLKTVTLPAAAGNKAAVYVGFKFLSRLGNNCSMDAVDIHASLPCASLPSDVIVTLTSTTTATLSWAEPNPAPGSGYQYFVSTSATAPTAATVPTGSVAAGVSSVNLTGLTANTTYYVWVRSACNGTDRSRWIAASPFTTTIATYCVPTVTNTGTYYIRKVEFQGTLQDLINNSTFTTTPRGYQDFTGLTPSCRQAQGQGVNLYVENTFSSLIKTWVDWNKNGTFDNSELIYSTNGAITSTTMFGFIIPASTPPGNYRIRVRSTRTGASTFGACENLPEGEAEDYILTVVAACPAFISSVNPVLICGSGTATLNVTGNASTTQYNWYATSNAALPIATTTTPSWVTPSIVRTETYYVTASNGTCESLERTPVRVAFSIVPLITFNPNNPVLCGTGTSLQLNATGDNEDAYIINEDFEGSTYKFTSKLLINNGATIDSLSKWRPRTSIFRPDFTSIWRPAISTGLSSNKFMFTTSDVGNFEYNNVLESDAFSTVNFTSLSLDYSIFYSHYLPDGQVSSPLIRDTILIEVSRNNGVTWNPIMASVVDLGAGTNFEEQSLVIDSLINVPSLRIRFRYHADWCDGAALDNIKIHGLRPLTSTYSWSPTTGNNLFLDAAGTIPYTGGSVTNVFFRPTQAQLDTGGIFPFRATATLSNGCSAAETITVTVTANLWTGTAGTDWNNVSNWCGGVIPTSVSRVVIPSGVPNYPILSNIGNVKSLRIDAGANMTIAATGTLNMGENLANSGTLANNGILNLNGTGPQVIPGSGTISSMNILRIANRGSGVTMNNSMFISNEIRPDSGKLNLANFDITLKSNASRTASVQKIGSTSGFLYGAGRFVVERYIPTGTGAGQHAKSWQHMAVPTNGGQTIKQAWQEGAVTPNGNPNPGFGTMITGAVLNATNAAIGFDVYTPTGGASIKTYNGSLNKWDFVSNTTNTPAYNPKGYLLFVRGDRSVINFSGANSGPIPTTLRTRGKIFEPVTNEPAVTNIPPNVLESIGNPYASAIDFSQIAFSDGPPSLITNKFWIFDPTLNTANNFGGWQLLTQTVNGDFTPVPGGTVNYPSGVINSKIQSGQAFIMQAGTLGGSVQFTEDAKVSGSANTFRSNRPSINRMSLGINLHAAQIGNLADGSLVVWDRNFTNDIDYDDALKMMNPSENLGIMSNRKTLTLESRRIITSSDTIQLHIKNLRRQNYNLKFDPKFFDNDINSISLFDRFTSQSSAISKNDTSSYFFTVNTASASFDSLRFYIVINAKKRIPVSNNIVEETNQSEIAGKSKQNESVEQKEITVSPNPVTGNKCVIRLNNTMPGTCNVNLKDVMGNIIFNKKIEAPNKNASFSLNLPSSISKGVYVLQIMQNDKTENVQIVIL